MCQEFSVNDSAEIEYSEVVQFENKSPEDSFIKLREWFASTFEVPEVDLILNDEENLKFLGKASIEAQAKSFGNWGPAGSITFSLMVQVREGRFKYKLNHVEYTGTANMGYANCDILSNSTCSYLTSRQWKSIKEHAINSFEGISRQIKMALIESDSEDW
jgi:hypothetical protein